MIDIEREREAETQAEGEAGSMHWEPDVGLDPGSPGSCPGPKAGAKLLSHPGIPCCSSLLYIFCFISHYFYNFISIFIFLLFFSNILRWLQVH